MHILVIHTCLDPMTVAVLDTASGRLDLDTAAGGAGAAERLAPLVAGVIAASGLAPAAIDRIAVTTGPGGFTGVRAGVAFARGFALVHAVPVIGFTVFEAIAASARSRAGDHPVAVALDDGRGGVALQVFGRDGRPLGPHVVVDLAGDLAGNLAGELAGGSVGDPAGGARVGPAAAGVPPDALAAGPRAAALGLPAVAHPPGEGEIAPAALAMLAAVRDGAGPPPEPVYLRPADAVPPRPSGLVARPEHPPATRPAEGRPAGSDQ